MKMEKTSYGSRPTILAADDYTAVPFHNDGSELIKAGTPQGGYTDEYAGVVLYDTPAGENGAVVVYGVIDVQKAMKASGIGDTEEDYITAVLGGVSPEMCKLVFRNCVKNQEGE